MQHIDWLSKIGLRSVIGLETTETGTLTKLEQRIQHLNFSPCQMLLLDVNDSKSALK